MNRFILLLLLICPGSRPGVSAQSVVRIESLPAQGILLDRGWKYHAGDKPDWAKPGFDDRQWPAIDPTKDIMELPQVRRAGTGWFRLQLVIASAVRSEPLALLLEQNGASDVYLNGRLLYRFGQIGTDGRVIQAYNPRGQPMSLAIGPDSVQTLAIRFAFDPDLPYTVSFARMNQNPLLRATLNGVTNAVRYDQSYRLGGLPLGCLQIGIYFILTILHLALYVYYPAQRANAFFSLYTLCCLLTYALQVYSVDLHSVGTLQRTRVAIAGFTVLFACMRVRALYSLFERPPGVTFWLLAAFCLLCLPLTVWPYRVGFNLGHSLFYLLCTAEELRLTVLAIRQQKRGAGLIARGVAISLVFGLIHGVLLPSSEGFRQQFYLTGNVGYFLLVNLPFNVATLAIPIAISLYLGLQFAFTNRTLTAKLTEVETLSARTQAQEAEKLRLVAEQNEQLEQTVAERTTQLRQQTDKLRELDGFKSRFFTNLTHEFRTPLTLILGPAEQVLAQTQEPGTKQQVGLIQRNGSRLLRLINQLLDLSKLEAGKMTLTTTPGDLVSLVRGTLQSFESMANQKGISLQFIATQERLARHVDRDKLEKILYNLLSNALKFTPAGGDVSVSLTNDESVPGWVQLTVQDTGKGIPAAQQPYIFDRFYQGSAIAADASDHGMPDHGMPDHHEQEGTGIGLALTKELVDLYGGTLHLSSQEGVGTRVVVRLPMLPASSVEDDSDQPNPSDQPLLLPVEPVLASTEAPLVLIIDDNDDVRAFIRSSLSGQAGGEPYRIIDAPDGEAGVQRAQQQVPDLVITDLMMPRMDGYAVCKTLKQDERTSHIPVIMLTARADLDSKLEGLETGADSYVAKPFSQRELLAQVANLIASRRRLREHYSRANVWQAGKAGLPSMEQVFLDRVRAAIETHVADEQYSVDRLSDDVGLSRTQLHRKLKALTNEAPGDLIRLMRLQRAHELLSGNVGTVAEVAWQVGFGNSANFSTSFSRHFGYAPSEVRKKANSLP